MEEALLQADRKGSATHPLKMRFVVDVCIGKFRAGYGHSAIIFRESYLY